MVGDIAHECRLIYGKMRGRRRIYIHIKDIVKNLTRAKRHKGYFLKIATKKVWRYIV